MTKSWTPLLARIAEQLCVASEPAQISRALLQIAPALPDATLLVAQPKPDGLLEVTAVAGPQAPLFEGATLPGTASLAGWAGQTRQPLTSPDVAVDPRASQAESGCGGGALLLPIGAGRGVEMVLGIYTVPSEDEELAAALSTMGHLAGLALERLALRRSQERQMRHFLALQEVSRVLASSLEDSVALELTVDVAMSLFNLDLCAVLLRRPDSSLRIEMARGVPGGVASRVRLAPEATPTPDLLADAGCPQTSSFPLEGRKTLMGYLVAGRRPPPLTAEESQILSTWAKLAGTALENSRIWQKAVDGREFFLRTLVATVGLVQGVEGNLTDRILGLSGAVARRLGWSEPDARDLEHLALLCHLARLARDGPLAVHLRPHLTEVPFRLPSVSESLAAYQAVLAGNAPSLAETPEATQIILAVEHFLRHEQSEESEGRNGQFAALVAIKSAVGRRFEPTVVQALEAVIWARLSISPEPVATQASDDPTGASQVMAAPSPGPSSPPARSAGSGSCPTLEGLTAREQDILRCVAEGMSNREIAAHLFLSEATVKTHVHRILNKLGLPDRTKAAVYLLQQRDTH